MRNALKLVSAAAVGFILGYAVCKRQLDQSYQDLANSEIADLKAHYEDRMKKEIDKAIQDYDAWLGENDHKDAVANEIVGQIVEEEGYSQAEKTGMLQVVPISPLTVVEATTPIDYSQYSPSAQHESPRHKAPSRDAYLISAEIFLSGESGYTQDALIWYSDDNVITDAGDKVITGDERTMLVGDGILERLVPKNGEPEEGELGALYFRNDHLGMDVEVNRVKGSFKEVAGLGDEPSAS